MSPHGYQEIDHTADLAIKVWGEDFFELLRNAALGLYDLMGVDKQECRQCQHAFSLAKGAAEIMLVDFLNELIYLAEEKERCFSSFLFIEKAKGVSVRCRGWKIKSCRRGIKAATFHDLVIRETENDLETVVTFDV